jgi:hypothetical protein
LDVRHFAEIVLILFLLDPAGFLKLAKLRHGAFELAGKALAVHAEMGQGFRLVEEPVHEVSGSIGDAEEIGFQ